MTTRYIAACVVAIASAWTLNAGQIAIGTGTAGTNGLTKEYMNPVLNVTTNSNPASTTSCSGASNTVSTSATGWNNCVVPATGTGFNIQASTYSLALFSSSAPTTAPTTDTIVAGGVTFERQNDPSFTTRSTWITAATTTTPSSFVVAVGIYGVDKVYTLLNDYWGGIDQQNTTVEFRFDDSSNGGGGVNPVKIARFDLVNGQTIRSSVNATSSTPTTVAGVNIATTLSGTYNANAGNGTVTAANAYTSGYTTGATNRYASTTGNVVLDYQTFDFGSFYATDFLVSLTIRNQLSAGQSVGYQNTRAALSAVTLNQLSAVTLNQLAPSQVPEPSTVFLAFAGLGSVCYFRRRKN